MPGNGHSDKLSDKLLAPLSAFYGNTDTVEIRICRPGQVIVETRGEGKKAVAAGDLTTAVVETICKALANRNGLHFDTDDMPKLSCTLPGGHRFECLLGDSVQSGISLAIRCKHPFDPTWEQLGVTEPIRDYLLEAVASEQNIIISGATNTGKTTLLNKLLATLPEDRRIIAVEDTPELEIDRFWDGVGLLAAREKVTGIALLDWRQLDDHIRRATPDSIIYSEISPQNAFAAMGAINSGVTGYMCTIHAGSPYQAIHRKFEQNIAWAGEIMPRVSEFLIEMIDLVVQIKRTGSKGFRRITDIYNPHEDAFIVKDEKVLL